MTTPKRNNTKKTLKELVEESTVHYPKIILMLSANNLLKQYEYELHTNEYVKPTMTESEFKKIIGE
jgi:hypothetical protein